MKKLTMILTMAAALLVRCQECPAQTPLGTSASFTATLTNATWALAATNAVGNTPLMTTVVNRGPGDIRYTWSNTNGVGHLLPAGGQVSIGPATIILETFFWRCASNSVTADAELRRDFKR